MAHFGQMGHIHCGEPLCRVDADDIGLVRILLVAGKHPLLARHEKRASVGSNPDAV